MWAVRPIEIVVRWRTTQGRMKKRISATVYRKGEK